MKASFKNNVHLEGVLYDHSLTERISGPNSKNPGTPFIMGTVKVATDAELTNVVEIHYSYITQQTKKGPNATYANLKSIIDGNTKTYMGFKGTEGYNPVYVRADCSIGLNDFYTDRNGTEELVSAKRCEGGFIHFIKQSELAEEPFSRNFFEADMVVTSAIRLEADEEKNLKERMRIKGVIFDFRRAILPVEFVLYDPNGMNMFEEREPSAKAPFCTQVRGSVVSQTTVIRKIEESAFGPAIVRELPRERKEFEVFSVFGQFSYPWDDESFITADALRKAMGDRETYLATVKKRSDDYKAQRQTTPSAATSSFKSNPGDFNF